MKIQPQVIVATYAASEKLLTDLLKEKYGDTSLKILYQDGTVRKVLMLDGQGIAKVYATASKTKEWMFNNEMLEADKAIQRGETIGEAFRNRNFEFRKNVLDVYTVSLSPWLRKDFATDEAFAKAKHSEFIVRKNDKIYNYALITEIYSPDFQPALISEAERAQVNFSFHTLKAAGFSREEIWRIVNNDMEGLAERMGKL